MDYQNSDEIKVSKPLRIIGKTIKWCFIALLVLMLCWLSFRAIMQNDTALMKKYIWTKDAAASYGSSPESLTVWEIGDYNTNELDKLFYISSIRYTEEIAQFQFTLRYNTQKEQKYIDAYGEEPVPQDLFTFVLVDNNGNKYTDYEYITDERFIYKYYRIVFSDINMEQVEELSVSVYRNTGEETDYLNRIDKCNVYFKEGYKDKYSLTKKEKSAEKPSSGLKTGAVVFTQESTTDTSVDTADVSDTLADTTNTSLNTDDGE